MKMMKVFDLSQMKRDFVFDFVEMRDFIVDDDENNNGFDYRKELRDTLKKNFRFDSDRYRARILRDDDDDDLRNMESSFDQIEKEEDYRLDIFSFLFFSRRSFLLVDE